MLAAVSLWLPVTIGLTTGGASKAAATFLLWPVLAFVWYLRLCGPDFRSSVYKTIVMVGVMCAPLAIVYPWRAPW